MSYAALKIQGNLKLRGYIRFNFTEVNDWIAKLKFYGLPLPSNTVIDALNKLIAGLYGTNIRSKILRLNLFCGGDWTGSLFPLITDLGTPIWDYNGRYGSTFADLNNGPFQSGDWSLINGFDPSRLNQYILGLTQSPDGMYLDTGVLTNNTSFVNGSIHASAHVNSLGFKNNTTDRLSEIGGHYNSYGIILRSDYKPYGFQNSNNPGFLTYSTSAGSTTNAVMYSQQNPYNPLGFMIGSRTSLSSTSYYKNGSIVPAQAGYFNPNTTTVFNPQMYNSSITIFSAGYSNPSNSGLGVARNSNIEYSDRQVTMYSLGYGLSDSDASTYSTLIANFNTAIGRTNF
jgi:hypothetical protein